jgi:putative methionine-R-sulfoxide reductase with GAF domain
MTILLPQAEELGVLRLLLELARERVDADESSVLLLDEQDEDLVFALTVGNDASHARLRGQAVPLGKGLTGLAAATREVQIGAPTFGVDQVDARKKGPSAVIAAPMLLDEDLVGVLTAVSFRDDKRFRSEDAAIYARVATIAGQLVGQRKRIVSLESRRGGGAPFGYDPHATALAARASDAIERIARARGGDHARATHLVEALEAVADARSRGGATG